MLNCHCCEHLIVYAFFTLVFIALLSLSVAVPPHQLTSGRYFILLYHIWILYSLKKKVSHSAEITSRIRYIDNIHTLSETIKFVYTSFRNGKKRKHLTSLSCLLRSDWKWIIYFPTIYVYGIYHVMSKAPKQLSNCLKGATTPGGQCTS